MAKPGFQQTVYTLWSLEALEKGLDVLILNLVGDSLFTEQLELDFTFVPIVI